MLASVVFVDDKFVSRLGLDFDGAQGVEARLFGRAGDGGDFLAVKADGEFAVARHDGGLDAGDLQRLVQIDPIEFLPPAISTGESCRKASRRPGCRTNNAPDPVTLAGASMRVVEWLMYLVSAGQLGMDYDLRFAGGVRRPPP